MSRYIPLLGASQNVLTFLEVLLTPLCVLPFFLLTILPSLRVLFCVSFLLLTYQWAHTRFLTEPLMRLLLPDASLVF